LENILRLTIELVPTTSWYNNMRKVVSQSAWDKIRKGVYAEYGHRCGICGAEGRLECNEIWEYDDINHIQMLQGFIALCPLCHLVKHIGFAGVQAGKGEIDYEIVVQHFMKVNKCNREDFDQYRIQVIKQWQIRSKYQWEVNLGSYENLIITKKC
jgi:hypothetical protein